MAKKDIEAGRASVKLMVDNSALVSGLRKASSQLKSFGTSVAKFGAGILAMGGTILGAFAAPIQAASDMEEVMNKFNVVFGENSASVKQWSDEFGSDVGRSKKQIAEFMAGAQDLFVPLGFAEDAALGLSKQVTQLAVDLASFNNMQDEDTMRDLQAALTGSGEVMKKYGVIVSEAAVKQELLNQGLDPKTATDTMKVQARMNLIMAGTTAAQGDAIRSAGSFANQMKSLKASISDAAVALGDAVLPAVTEFVTKAVSIVKIAANWVSENQELVRTVFKIAIAVTAAGAAIVGIGTAIAGAGFVLGGIGTAMSALVTVLGVVLSPLGIITGIVVAGVVAWARWTKSGQAAVSALGRLASNIFGTLKETWGGVVDALMSGDFERAGKIAITGLRVVMLHGLTALADSMTGVFGDVVKNIGGKLLRGDLQGAWDSVLLLMGAGWDAFMAAILDTMKATIDMVRAMWNTMIAAIDVSLIGIAMTLRKYGGKAGAAAADALGAASSGLRLGSGAVNTGLSAGSSTVGALQDAAQRRAAESRDVAADDIVSGSNQTSKELTDLQRELAEANDEARKARNGIAGGAKAGGGLAVAGAAGDMAGANPGEIAKSLTSAATFSGAALAAMAGGANNIPKQQLEVQRKQLAKMDEEIKAIQALELGVVG